MLKIIEKKINSQNVYEVSEFEKIKGKLVYKNSRLVNTQIIRSSYSTFICSDQYTGEIIDDLNKYQIELVNSISSINSISAKLYRLKPLYNFISIFGLTLYEKDKKGKIVNSCFSDNKIASLFVHFVQKRNYVSEDLEMTFIEPLSNGSCNNIMNSIRNYLEFIGLDESNCILFKKTSTGLRNKANQLSVFISGEKYFGTQPTNKYKEQLTEDKVFSEKEVALILSYIEDDKCPLIWRVIVNILLHTAMRIGTLLSLTEEDVHFENDKLTGITRRYLIARNRCSNNGDQLVKNVINIRNKNQYNTAEYKAENVGFFKYEITPEIYSMISELRKSYKNIAKKSEEAKENYNNNALADSATEDYLDFNKKNHYLFLNSNLKRMSQDNLRKRYLNPMLDYLGIKRDKNKKSNGAFHKFRHTVVTLLLQNGVLNNLYDVLTVLKDKSPDVAEKYINLTQEQCLKISNKTYEVIQKLKGGGPLDIR